MFIGYLTGWVRFKAPAPFDPKGNSKFETITVKMYSLKRKNKFKYFQLLQKKSNFYFPRKQLLVPLDKGLQECKTKAIQANLGTFRHNQTYPGIIQGYPGIFKTLSYPDIFKAVVYPEH